VKRKKLVHYVRYTNDIVLLARTRWQLRRAIAVLHEEIATLGLRLRQYVLRWWRWHLGGLDGMVRWKGGIKRTLYHVLTHLGLKHPPG
jgi:hypothetical protein